MVVYVTYLEQHGADPCIPYGVYATENLAFESTKKDGVSPNIKQYYLEGGDKILQASLKDCFITALEAAPDFLKIYYNNNEDFKIDIDSLTNSLDDCIEAFIVRLLTTIYNTNASYKNIIAAIAKCGGTDAIKAANEYLVSLGANK